MFGTQVEQQLQDGTVSALCVSCCKSGLVSCIFLELQNCQCSTAVGHPLPRDWSHISVCPDLLELLFLRSRFSRKKTISIDTFHFLTFARVNPQFIQHDLCHRPVCRLFCIVCFVMSIYELPRCDRSSTGHHRKWQPKKGSRLCLRLIEKSDFFSQPSISYRLYTKFRPPLLFVRAIETSV